MTVSRIDRVLLSLLGVSLAFNIAQHGLPMWISERIGAVDAPPPSPLVGRTVRPVTVKTIDGAEERLEYEGLSTILYVLSPQCNWCRANTPVITDLARQRADEYRFIGLSMTGSGLTDYLEAEPLPFPVYVIPNPFDTIWEDMNLGATPYMVAVGPDATIEGAWPGALYRQNRAAVREFFALDSLAALRAP